MLPEQRHQNSIKVKNSVLTPIVKPFHAGMENNLNNKKLQD